ncbi:MAG: diacylglycerol/lipid kinase family protein, partial [Sphingomonadales bacterium]
MNRQFHPRCSDAAIVQLAVNPAAGRHDRAKVDALARALERRGATVIRTECGPHRAFELDARAGQVCAIGGDGTARHVAVAASRSGRPVGISLYPAGTINLLHRERAGALDPDLRAAALLAGDAGRNHYAASINDSLFLACASVGPDSAAVAVVSPRLKARVGRLAYAAAFLRVLLAWPRRPIALRSNGRTIACEAFYVAKGRFFAGPWSFAPEASVGDPLLHVVALAKLTRRRYAR